MSGKRNRRPVAGAQLQPGSWRYRARATIQRVRQAQHDAGVTDPQVVLKAIDDAYPFGMREYDPYKSWLFERSIAARSIFNSPLGLFCRTCRAKIGAPCRGSELRMIDGYHRERTIQQALPMPLFDGGS